MLAQLESETVQDYIDGLRSAVEAGRRDLGPVCFEEDAGVFWGLIETRPFMRAMGMLADAFRELGTVAAIDEAINIYEEMLALNPNDNQGVREPLAGCYLVRRRYDAVSRLFEKYPDDWLATPAWIRVLHAFATGDTARAASLLVEARKRNAHVEAYLTGTKRRPRHRSGSYSPGDESEAVYCADTVWAAWKRHPKACSWLREACQPCP
ncbi:MAG: tetratricopeptide repeat protein [Gammaproteobacteria bacterium]|nr:tetratricopeptide repeat protein [Gammaproteobacteria bacterium]